MEIILCKIALFTIQSMSLIYCKNPVIIIHIFTLFLFVLSRKFTARKSSDSGEEACRKL